MRRPLLAILLMLPDAAANLEIRKHLKRFHDGGNATAGRLDELLHLCARTLFNPASLESSGLCVSPIARRATGEVKTLHAASNGREPNIRQFCKSHPEISISRPA